MTDAADPSGDGGDASGATTGNGATSGGDSDSAGAGSSTDSDASGDTTEATTGDGGTADAAEVAALRDDVDALEETLAELTTELTARDRPRRRPPGLGTLRRLTTEVSIPLAILVLETNVRALRILQRALEEESGGSAEGAGEAAGRVGRRAADVSGQALDRLGDVLADLQESVTARDRDETVDGLLAEATTLQERVASELRQMEAAPGARSGTEVDAAARGPETGEEAVAIDVDAELESIKTEIEDEHGDEDG